MSTISSVGIGSTSQTTVGAITIGSWQAGPIGLPYGGTNASLSAALGAVVYSTGTALALLAPTATARQMLQSGASAAPSWSTTTWPATTTINTLLYSSAANVISALATANSATLITSSGGVPSLSQTLPSAVQGNITTVGAASGSVITIGNILGATSLAMYVTSGGFILDGTANATYTIGASAVAGTISIGGTAQTGTMTLGSSSAPNTVILGGGAGLTTINIATGAGANVVTIGSTAGAASLALKAGSGGVNITGVVNISTLSPSFALMTDGSSNVITSIVTSTELGYVHGTTSKIQTQIDNIVASYVTSVNGTTNQVIVSPPTGPVFVSLPSTLIAPGTVTSTGLLTGLAGITVTGAAINLGADAADFAVNIGTGASSGRTITIGSSTGATGIVQTVGTGNFSLDGAAGSNYAIGASTTTGTITIGGTNTTGIISIGLSTGTSIIRIGLSTGATTVNIAQGGTNGKTVNIATGNAPNVVAIGSINGVASLTLRTGTGNFSLDGNAASTYTIGASTTTGTITIGGTSQTGTITLGSSDGTNIVAIGAGTGATTVNIAGGATNAKAVNIGTGAVANTITIGNATGATSIALNTGTGGAVVNGKGISVIGKNLLFNGAMLIWQRGAGGSASIAVAASTTAYTADRWLLVTGASVASTVSQQAGALSGSYYARVQRNSGQTGTAVMYFAQSLTRDMSAAAAGNQITLQFTALCGANFSPTSNTISVTVYSGTGSTDIQGQNAAFTGSATPISTTQTLTTSAVAYTFTSAAVVSASATQLCVQFSWTPSGTAGANDWAEFTNVALVVSPTATVYENVPFGDELSRCQYFYDKSFRYATAPAQNAGENVGESIYTMPFAGAVQNQSPTVYFKRTMRAVPTMTLFNPLATNAQIVDESTGTDFSGTAIWSQGDAGFAPYGNGPVGSVVGNTAGVHWTASAEL